ncbi:MAG: FprA family A-type flavoprotein [Clostridia bacterium]|nr:FprA family A-type flavoprotein [Clostridia bacterium]
MNITNDIKYIGVDDKKIDLFEGQYKVPSGMSYNSYVIIDEKVAVMDTVDAAFGEEWLTKLKAALEERVPDYLVVHHMEPDHSANIENFVKAYPSAKIVASSKAFAMMKGFFGTDFADRQIVAKDNDVLDLGKHKLTFIAAPMIHWPEVMVSYDSYDKVLFSADGFGKFGASDSNEPWDNEARRYYIGIVGKYGAQVQNLLKKAAALNIEIICSLHGPVLRENIERYVSLYDTWSSYSPEESGVVIAYASIYGNTKAAAIKLSEKLRSLGEDNVVLYDLSRCDISEAVSDSFRYDRLVLASATYNADVFPPMKEFINHLTERGFKRRKVGLIENGSWAPMAAKVMREMLEVSRDLSFTETTVKITSALSNESLSQLDALACELSK